jgi:hypothetical protein
MKYHCGVCDRVSMEPHADCSEVDAPIVATSVAFSIVAHEKRNREQLGDEYDSNMDVYGLRSDGGSLRLGDLVDLAREYLRITGGSAAS